MELGEKLFLLALVISSLANLGLGIYVLRYKRKGVNLIFFFLMLLLFLWQIMVPTPLLTKREEIVLTFNRLGVLPTLPLPGLFVHFSYLFVSQKLPRKIIFLIYLPVIIMAPLAFADLTSGSGFFISRLEDSGGVSLPVFGNAFYLYGLYLISAGIWGCSLLLGALARERNYIFRNQIKYVVLGIGGIIAFYFTIEIVLPLVINRRFLSPTSLATIFMNVSIAYGIIRSRAGDRAWAQVKDLGEILRRGLVYLIAVNFSLLLYFTFIWGLGYKAYLLDTLLVLILFPFFVWLLRRVGRYVEATTNEEGVKRRSILAQMELGLFSTLDLGGLSDLLVDAVSKAMELESCALFLQEEGGNRLTIFRSRGLNPDSVRGMSFAINEDFVNSISHRDYPLDSREVLLTTKGDVSLFSFTEERLSKLASVINVALKAEGHLVGILSLGRKSGARKFNGNDRELLRSVAAKVGPSLANSIAYERLKAENRRLRGSE